VSVRHQIDDPNFGGVLREKRYVNLAYLFVGGVSETVDKRPSFTHFVSVRHQIDDPNFGAVLREIRYVNLAYLFVGGVSETVDKRQISTITAAC
jgi:hypothetical protein